MKRTEAATTLVKAILTGFMSGEGAETASSEIMETLDSLGILKPDTEEEVMVTVAPVIDTSTILKITGTARQPRGH